MAWEVVNTVPTADDWRGTTWVVRLEEAGYLSAGATIHVEENLDVSVTEAGVASSPTIPGHLLDSGQLICEGTTVSEAVRRDGTVAPVGTRFWIVASMVTFEDLSVSPPDVQRHLAGLTLVDDPEDAGIIGADEG